MPRDNNPTTESSDDRPTRDNVPTTEVRQGGTTDTAGDTLCPRCGDATLEPKQVPARANDDVDVEDVCPECGYVDRDGDDDPVQKR